MARAIQPIDIEGQVVWVEIDDLPVQATFAETGHTGKGKFDKTSATGEIAEAATDAIKKANISSTLKVVLQPIRSALAEFKAEEFSIEFTLGFKAGGGVFIASGEANAQLKVSAKFKPTGESPSKG